MTKDLMVLLGIEEEEEICTQCGNVIDSTDNTESGLCETCRDDLYYDSFDEGDNSYL